MKTKISNIGKQAKTSTLEPKALEAPEVEVKAESNSLKKLLVSRMTWARGEGSHLLNEGGRMCILGQYLDNIGVPRGAILLKGSPSFAADLSKPTATIIRTKAPWLFREKEPDVTGHYDSDAANTAININDNDAIEDSERETGLKNLFQEHGVDLEFVD